jgi:hypothetical protein
VGFTAAGDTKRLVARLTRGGRTYASRKRVVRPGRAKISLRPRRRVPTGRYRLVMTFYDRDGKTTKVSRKVRVRR